MEKKTASIPMFNKMVKILRKKANMTQLELAVALNPHLDTGVMVSRWEHGTPIGPRYRQRLCHFFEGHFGVSADTLGLIWSVPVSPEPLSLWSPIAVNGQNIQQPSSGQQYSPEQIVDLVRDHELFASDTTPPLTVTQFRFPTTLPDPLADDDLIGRKDQLAQCREYLRTKRFLALYGLPGVGKSAVATKLAHDRVLQRRFPGGVLFAALGPEPDIVGLLSSWGAQLGLVTAAAANVVDAETWGRAINATIGERRLLLVIDDAWTIEHLLAFKVGGPNCCYIVTTRFLPIAASFAGGKTSETADTGVLAGAMRIHELTEELGSALLVRLAPQAVETDPRATLALVRSVGGLPLALQLMGNYLRMEAASGRTRRVRRAVAVLHDTKKRINLELIQGSLERPAALPPGTTLSLRAILDVSTKRMKQQKAAGKDAYQALKILSLFAPKPSSFSEEAALAVCGGPNSALDVLVDFGLLEVRSAGRYTIHQVVHDYACVKWCEETPQAAQHTTQRRLVEYYSALLRAHARDFPRLECENQNILAALSIALNLGMPKVFLEAILAFAPCMEMQGQYTKSKDLLESAADVAVALGDSRALAGTRLHLGRLAELRGEYEQAAHLYDEGLSTTAQMPQDAARIALLARRADIALCCDDSRQAEQLVRQGLQLADQLGDQQETGFLLRVQAHIAGNQGDLQLGDTLYPAALELALAAEDIETVLVCLQHLGVIAFKRGQYDAAEKYFTEGLRRAHQLGHVRRIAALQNALGCVKAEYATMQRHAPNHKQQDTWFQEAERLYRACLTLATDFELPYWLNNALQNLGALERARQRYTQAERYLDQALQIAHKLRDRWLISETECERGKVYLETGLIEKAITAYEKALEVASDGGDMEVELAGLAYFGLGRAFAVNGQFRQAFHYGTMSLRHLSDLGFVARAREVNDWLEALPLADC